MGWNEWKEVERVDPATGEVAKAMQSAPPRRYILECPSRYRKTRKPLGWILLSPMLLYPMPLWPHSDAI
jgi:hypothetical protein